MDHAASRGTTSDVYTHIQGGKGRHTHRRIATLRQPTKSWKHGTKGRQGKIGNQDTPLQESQSSDLTVFFLPLM